MTIYLDLIFCQNARMKKISYLSATGVAGNDDRYSPSWFQQDGASAHNAPEVGNYLNATFPNQCIRRGGPVL